MMKAIFIIGLFSLIFLLTGCAEEEERPLPYVPVNFSVFLSSHPELMAGLPEKVGQREYGYNKNGVIIVPKGYGTAEYEAYDATCTYNVNVASEMVSINVDGDLTATCPRCKTVYHIRTGGASADGKYRLQRYNASWSNDRIYVYN